jgi:hypothetical protein
VSVTKAEDYRLLAQECLEIARTIASASERTVLIDIAQSWLELAEQQEAATPPMPVEDRPVMQQQQQVQPKDKKK